MRLCVTHRRTKVVGHVIFKLVGKARIFSLKLTIFKINIGLNNCLLLEEMLSESNVCESSVLQGNGLLHEYNILRYINDNFILMNCIVGNSVVRYAMCIIHRM